MKFFNLFKKNTKTVQNLPQLINKINKDEISPYVPSIPASEGRKKDPLYMRIDIENIDYIKEYRNELSIKQKYITIPLRKCLLRFPIISNLFPNIRFEKEIYRPNPELREIHFGDVPKKYKFSVISIYVVTIIFAYIVGYFWSKLKYDISTRRFMYSFLFSFMMAFEYIDYHAENLMEYINTVFPKEMSDKELEYILYKKITSFLVKRRMNKNIEEILKTDPELFEIERLLKRINNK